MTTDRFREILVLLHWPTFVLAEEIDVSPSIVMRWLQGSEPVPEDVGSWLEGLAAAFFPVPKSRGTFAKEEP